MMDIDTAFLLVGSLCGINPRKKYLPGIVTLTVDDTRSDHVLYLVAWKIDDVAWIVATTGRDHLSDADYGWKYDVAGFSKHAGSWRRGIAIFKSSLAAKKLREQINNSAKEYGIVLINTEHHGII